MIGAAARGAGRSVRAGSRRPAVRRRGGILAAAPILTLTLFIVPIGLGLAGTWAPAFGYLPALGGTDLSLEPWRELLAAPGLAGAAALSLWTGLLSTALSLAGALGLCAALSGTTLFRAVQRWLAPLLAVPHAALAIGLAFLLASSGWLTRLVAPLAGWDRPPALALVQDPHGLALVFGLMLKELPFLLLMALAALGQVRADRTLTVARAAGYGPVRAWLKTVLPQIYPLMRLPIYAVLAFGLSVVDMALILGPTTPPTLAPLILRWFNDPDLSLRFMAAAGAVLQLTLVVGAIALWHGLERLVARLARPWLSAGDRGGSGRLARAVTGSLVGLVLAAAAVSILSLAAWSVADRWRYPDVWPSAWSLDNWHEALGALLRPAWITLSAGLAAAGIAVALAIGCLEYEQQSGVRPSTRALWLLYLPLLVPQIAFLFGIQVFLVTVGMDGTWAALVWAHLLFVLPYTFLALADPWRSHDERYARTALCLGISPVRAFWRLKLPMLLRPVLFAAAIGFAVSVAQYLPTLFAGAGRLATLTTEAVGLAQGADRRIVGVYAFTQMLLPLIGFLLALALPAFLFRHRRGMRL